jgi:hypothetical protein
VTANNKLLSAAQAKADGLSQNKIVKLTNLNLASNMISGEGLELLLDDLI